nr:MAG TPA: hypothetical protein [Caudoviricetes sp.]
MGRFSRLLHPMPLPGGYYLPPVRLYIALFSG